MAATVPSDRRPRSDTRRAIMIGVVGLVVMLGVLGGWSVMTVISGAVIASGQTLVQGKPKLVQSLDGGIANLIAVKDGDQVKEGQILLEIDDSLLKTNLDIARNRLAAALALKGRLEAEQSGLDLPIFDYPALPFDPADIAREESNQRQIFAARAEIGAGRRARLTETIRQYEARITGTEAQIESKREQLTYIEKDLASVNSLIAKGLARQSQLTDLQRSQSEIQGQIAGLSADLAAMRTAIQDAELETLQSENGFKEEVATDLREVTTQIEELTLEIATRRMQLERTRIHAPIDGTVHELQVTTVGGVITPGATILEIVPLSLGVEFEIRIDPRAIEQVYPGQKAQLMISSLDPRSAPRLKGEVSTISPGVVIDPATGQHYYRASLQVPPQELARLGDISLMPGMPVEAYLETGDRTIMAYLLHPLTTRLQRAFREE